MSGLVFPWRRYEELRPDELRAQVDARPVAIWPLGLLEHHGWHLPIGFDGLKAEQLSIKLAERVGGVVLPVMWWGGEGGHGPFLWTHYQSPQAAGEIVAQTVGQLMRYGFRAIVLLAGHYPWQEILDKYLATAKEEASRRGVLMLYGHEGTIARPAVSCRGDHAAKEETSFGLALLPELVDLKALTAGRDPKQHWPEGNAATAQTIHPCTRSDVRDGLFAQMGEDARQASAEHGRKALEPMLDYLARRILDHLG
ncbi:MAG: creatininase family protein [Phycisphaeraceae bacterium]|nr:creatininase family protein [Phycisphaeraceae bacterium]